MVLGCGVDLADVARFEREVARRGDALIEELFSASERAWCRRRRRAAEGYAMDYAAKEAVFKALGTGKVGRMAWHDIDVAWPEGAAGPTVTLTGETAAVAEGMGVRAVRLAVATTREHAVGWVVLTGFETRDSGFACRGEAERSSSTAGLLDSRIPNPESRRT